MKITKKQLIQRVGDILSGACGTNWQDDPDCYLGEMLNGEERSRWAKALNAVFFGSEKSEYGFTISKLDLLDSIRDAAEALWEWKHNFGKDNEDN